jgi:predicted DsbA family dithiol-disulfide isomerase
LTSKRQSLPPVNAKALGINGVPTFFLNGQPTFSGAVAAPLLADTIRRALRK